MEVRFKNPPELLRVVELGDFIEANDSLRQKIAGSVLAAVCDNNIPLRNKAGSRVSLHVLGDVANMAHQVAANKTREELGKIEARIKSRAAQDFDDEVKRRAAHNEGLQAIARLPEKPILTPEAIMQSPLWRDVREEQTRLLAEKESSEARDWMKDRFRKGFVRLSEVADWLRKDQGFDVMIVESSIAGNGEIAQKLAKWFDTPISDLPREQSDIAEAYIPRWAELSGAERRTRAADADRELQERIGARFERARMDAEQANAATPARFAQRDRQDGFDKVERERAGERHFEAKRAAFNLTDERCIELARIQELGIMEWIQLTGVGIGEYCGMFRIAMDGVSFIKWEQDLISDTPAERQIDMLRENSYEPLEFPCTPARMLDFIDSELCTVRGCFSVPDAFRQAVTAIAPTLAPAESQEQTGPAQAGATVVALADGGQSKSAPLPAKPDTTRLVAWQTVMLDSWQKIVDEHGAKPSAIKVLRWLRTNGPMDTFPKGPNNLNSLVWIDRGGNAHTLTTHRLGTVLSEWRKAKKIPA